MAGQTNIPRRQSRSYVNNRPTPALLTTSDGRRFTVEPGERVSWVNRAGQVGRPYTLDFRPSRVNEARNPALVNDSSYARGGVIPVQTGARTGITQFGGWSTSWVVVDESMTMAAEAVRLMGPALERINATARNFRRAVGDWPLPPVSNQDAAVPIPESSLSNLNPRPEFPGKKECACGDWFNHRWEHSTEGCDWRGLSVTLDGYEPEDEDD